MKKSMKKLSIVFLAACVALSAAACGGGQTESSGTAGSTASGSGTASENKPITLTAFACEGPYTKGDFNDLAIWKEVEKKSGIKVNFEAVPSASFTEKVGLKFASNDLPDMFFKCPLQTADITKYAAEGQLVPIDGYLEKDAPNFTSYMKKDASIEKNLKMADGHIYGFTNLVTAAPSRLNPKLFYNETWLKAQGLTVPATTDELYTVLKAMKTYDYNKNGKADEIPLTFDSQDNILLAFMGSFGLMTRGSAQQTWDIDPKTDKLRFVKTSDNYKQLLQYLNKLYKEKLVDQEVFSLGTDGIAKVSAKAAQNIIGMAFIYNTNYLGDAAKDFSYFKQPFKGPNGDQAFSARTIPVVGQNTFITKVNKHPEETVKWVDYFYSEEGITAYYMGIEGKTYQMVNGVPQYTDYVTKNPDGLNMEEALGTYVCWSGGGNPSVADDIHFGNHLIPKTTVDAASSLMNYTPKEIWGSFVYSTEDNDRLSVLQTDIDTYVKDMTAKFITGDVGFDKWEEYKAKIDGMGLKEYTEITQRALDAYNSK